MGNSSEITSDKPKLQADVLEKFLCCEIKTKVSGSFPDKRIPEKYFNWKRPVFAKSQ